MKKDTILQIVKFIVTVLTAVLTTFGVASCANVPLTCAYL